MLFFKGRRKLCILVCIYIYCFFETISVSQRFVLDSSESVGFSGEFVWRGHAGIRELISERWKNSTSSVDAAFRRGPDSVFLIKVLLGQGKSWAGKSWNQH